MKFYENKSIFNYTWEQVAVGFWQRYPNPYSSHVLSEDTVKREVLGGCLRSMRLLTKTNLPPKWGEHVVAARTVKIIEESVVNPKEKTFTTYTRNVGLTRLMSIVEKVVYKESVEDPSKTVAERSAWIDSQVFGLSRPIQAFGMERFKKNCKKAEQGFTFILSHLFPSGHPHLPTTKHFVEQQKEKLRESAKRATELAKAKAPIVACQTEM